MKHLMKLFAFLFSSFIIVSAFAECPDGKSEVVVVTSSGISKTICLPDSVIPKIESATDHSPQFDFQVQCPCLDVWDGYPYPETAEVEGTPPVLPDDLSLGWSCIIQYTPGGTRLLTAESSGAYPVRFSAENDEGNTSGVCIAYQNMDGQTNRASVSGTIFSEWINGASPTMDACQDLLEERGCVFPQFQ